MAAAPPRPVSADDLHTEYPRRSRGAAAIHLRYRPNLAAIDYNCMYESAYYRARQLAFNDAVLALCPGQVLRYVNTPSNFLTARDYYGNDYDALAATKTRWDPDEVFRVYQGVRPTGVPVDAYNWTTPYERTRTVTDVAMELAWDVARRHV